MLLHYFEKITALSAVTKNIGASTFYLVATASGPFNSNLHKRKVLQKLPCSLNFLLCKASQRWWPVWLILLRTLSKGTYVSSAIQNLCTRKWF